MRNKLSVIIILIIAFNTYASNMELFECEGNETGKVKGYVAKEQLLIECFNDSYNCDKDRYEKNCRCSIKFGLHKFEGVKNEDGSFSSSYTMTGLPGERNLRLEDTPSYFKFDPQTGYVQGVTLPPWYYFIGKCKKH